MRVRGPGAQVHVDFRKAVGGENHPRYYVSRHQLSVSVATLSQQALLHRGYAFPLLDTLQVQVWPVDIGTIRQGHATPNQLPTSCSDGDGSQSNRGGNAGLALKKRGRMWSSALRLGKIFLTWWRTRGRIPDDQGSKRLPSGRHQRLTLGQDGEIDRSSSLVSGALMILIWTLCLTATQGNVTSSTQWSTESVPVPHDLDCPV